MVRTVGALTKKRFNVDLEADHQNVPLCWEHLALNVSTRAKNRLNSM